MNCSLVFTNPLELLEMTLSHFVPKSNTAQNTAQNILRMPAETFPPPPLVVADYPAMSFLYVDKYKSKCKQVELGSQLP